MTNKRFLGKYEALKELGRGGFGVVYEAKDHVLSRNVALKVLHGQLTVDPLFLARFEQEAKLAARLEHPNLVPVYDFGQDKGYNYIVMGLMKGGSLKDRLQKHGALGPDQARIVFEQILEGVSHIHQNVVVHRDLKPSNILFDHHDVAHISDLGFAKAVRSDVSSSMSTSGAMVGTAAYMAPEVWHGKKATAQSDIYSLGCIAYEMLTGEMLFYGETSAESMTKHLITGPQMDPNLPEPWRKLIEKCLAKDLTERYLTAKAVLEDLKFGLFNVPEEGQSESVLTSIDDTPAEKDAKQTTAQAPPIAPIHQNVFVPRPTVRPVAPNTKRYETFYYHESKQETPPPPADKRQVPSKAKQELTPEQMLELPPLKRMQKKKPWLMPLILVVLLALVGSVVWVSVKMDRERQLLAFDTAKQTITSGADLSRGESNTLTQKPSATPTMEVALPSSSIQAVKVGFYDDELGYEDYPISGENYPTWSISESGSESPIMLDQENELRDGMHVQTFGDVGVMFSIGAQDIGGQSQGNNQLHVYGGSSLTVRNEAGLTDISLSEGSIYLKMTTKSEIANVVFPAYNNVTARLTGGAGLFVTGQSSISFWCLSEDCQFEYGDDAKALRKGQIRVYDALRGTLSDVETFSPPSDRYEEYLHWNEHCNHCLPFDLVPEPTYTPTPTSLGRFETNTPTPTRTATAQARYTLTVIVEGQGRVSPNGGTYQPGTRVTLTASPASGWKFASWSTGSHSLTTTIIMDSDKTITASFVKEAAVIYTLTVNIEGNGAVNPNGGKFEKGTVVTLTATPAEGWNFTKWSTGVTSPTTTVKMDGDKTITAFFTEKQKYKLTVNITGQGTVSLDPPGGMYYAGTQVTLTASPAEGWEFTKWNTGATSPTITVTMTGDKAMGAVFTEIPATKCKLTVIISGQGSVSLDPPGGTYDAGTQVTLTASPSANWEFEKWSTGETNPVITVTMNSNMTIIATFKENQKYLLKVNINGQGSVDPPGGMFYAGTPVTLTATPSENWEFEKWSTGETNPVITVTMNSDLTITATFKEQAPTKYTLTVIYNPMHGSVSLDPPGGSYYSGTLVTLTASPAPGWEFEKWSDPYGSTNSLTVTMDSDLTITAYFIEQAPTRYKLAVNIDGKDAVSIIKNGPYFLLSCGVVN